VVIVILLFLIYIFLLVLGAGWFSLFSGWAGRLGGALSHQTITTTHSQNGQTSVYLAFFGIIDRTSYTGQNYHTNTIIIVHLATLTLDYF